MIPGELILVRALNCTCKTIGSMCARPRGLKSPLFCINENIFKHFNEYLITPNKFCKMDINLIFFYILQMSILIGITIIIIFMALFFKKYVYKTTHKEKKISLPFTVAERFFRPNLPPPPPPEPSIFEEIELK
ncbi:hypothetical protein Mgra_00004579 [Meloidogyne graminicola]|uniref:Uncharacterized protein n=1 Tax=Meloidogyne graminicola TaxID=189291 RepID=A0A8S9ZS83_9BILA|nr:hypothetical protein Mgra_00004579 [Meloidogyne graminicola]